MTYLLYLITTGIINFAIFDYFYHKYDKNYSLKIYIIIFIVYSIIIATINLCHIPLLNLFVNFISYIIIDIYGYEHEVLKEYFEDIVYLLLLMFLDTISYFIVGFIYPQTESIHIFRNLSSSLIVLFMNMTVKRYISSTKIEDIPAKDIIIYFVITLFYLLVIFIFSKNYDTLQNTFFKGLIIFIVIGQVVIDIVIYYYLNYVGKAYRIEKNLNESNKQIELKNTYYKTIKKSYNDTRKAVHDFKRYLQVIEDAYKNNFESGQRIKEQVLKKLNTNRKYYNTSSEILDIILFDKERESKKHNIEFDFKMEIIDLNYISEIDIITIFGNLYDNAIEANINILDKKYIHTAIYQIEKMLIIRIANSCGNSLIYKNNKIKSTKKKHEGIGTENINRTVRKYGGIFDLRIDNNECIATITIPML